MSRFSPRRVLGLSAVVTLVCVAAAFAFFTGANGQQSAAASVGSMTLPGSPAAGASGTTNIQVTWIASTVGGSSAATSYTVERYSGTGTDLGNASCGTVPSSAGVPNAFGSFSCLDSPGASGSFKYKIVARYLSSWTTTTAYTNTVTLTAASMSAPATGATNAAISKSSLSSVLSGATSGATGTITYKVFGPQASAPSTCTTGGSTVGTATVGGPGTYNPSAGYTPTTAGTYWWYASYARRLGQYRLVQPVRRRHGLDGGDEHHGDDRFGTRERHRGYRHRRQLDRLNAVGRNGEPGGRRHDHVQRVRTADHGAGDLHDRRDHGRHGHGLEQRDLPPVERGFTPSAAGTYWWYASYGGDTLNSASSSPCGAAMSSTTVAKASPTETVAAPSTDPAATPIAASSISSTLASATTGATGTITIKVFAQTTAPTTCTTGGTTVGTATVSGNGTYNPSAGYTPTAPGTLWWYASYAGDANNNTSTTTCGGAMTKTTVGKASPTTTVSAPGTDATNTAIATSSISATLAQSTSTAGGTITFKVFGPQTSAPSTCTTGGTTVGTATASGSGTYHPSAGFTPTTAGAYWWYASYGGDTNNNASNSTCGAGMSATTVSNTTATTAAGPASGTAGTAIPTSSISSVLSGGTTAPAAGGTITFTVFGPQSTAPIICTSGGTTVGAATVSGNGTYHPSSATTPQQVGTYWWYASYSGDATTYNSASSSTCGTGMASTTVGKASPTLSAGAPATDGTNTAIPASSLSAVLSSSTTPATGTVTYKVFGPQTTAPTLCTTGGTTVGTATATGAGTFNPSAGYTPTTIGTYWWYVSYNGDSNNNAATSTCGTGMTSTIVKNQTALTVTAPATNPTNTNVPTSAIGSTLSGGTTSPAVSGTLTISVIGPQASAPIACTGGTVVATDTVTANGTYHPAAAWNPATAGTYWWYATYGGDTNNFSSNATCGAGMTSTVVANATTTTMSAPGTAAAGSTISSGSLGGILQGVSSGGTGTITFTVFGPQTTAPSTCTSGGTSLGTASVSGPATYHPSSGYAPQAPGNYWWYASYGGDSSNTASNSGCGSGMTSTTVSIANPTLNFSAPSTNATNTAIPASSLSATLASATSGATGTITYKVFGPQTTAPATCTSGGTTIGTATVSGPAAYNPSAGYTPSTPGTYWWYARYAGDANDNAAASTCGSGMTSTVVTNQPTLTVSAPASVATNQVVPGTSITTTLSGATTSPLAGGTIGFMVFGPQPAAPTNCTGGATVGGSVTVSGNGTYHATSTWTPGAAGTYWWYSSYSGDANNSAASSRCGAGMTSTVVQ